MHLHLAVERYPRDFVFPEEFLLLAVQAGLRLSELTASPAICSSPVDFADASARMRSSA